MPFRRDGGQAGAPESVSTNDRGSAAAAREHDD
jgi:hypothetical protein